MQKLHVSRSTAWLPASASLLGLLAGACNKQPAGTTTEAAMVAPPAAALPMATGAPAAAIPPAPDASALPPVATHVAYAPPPPAQRYRYVDRAYSMTQAFADTPPDYAVDYQGTRPWIWRANNGAYRIVERLPRGERYYYYEPGADQPFLVQDPDYAYAYDNGRLASVYGPDGSEIADAMAERRAQEASLYWYRARQLYRAAQYQQRQSAYASEWASRRDDLRRQDAAWQRQQKSNSSWRSWHDAHATELRQQWQPERNQRIAYAAALGIAPVLAANGARTAQPTRAGANPADVAQRQATYFAKWKASPKAEATGATTVAVKGSPATPIKAPSVAASVPMAAPAASTRSPRMTEAAQGKAAAAADAARVKPESAQTA